MKHVRLPIFDEDGIELDEHLEVSVEILQRMAKVSTIYRGHVKVVSHPKPTPEEEIEMVDRIIAGLPIDAVEISKARLESVNVSVDGYGSIELVDVVSKYPDGLDYDTVQSRWRRIPGFNAYRMSPTKHICDDNHMSVHIVKGGRIDNVLLSNDDGITKRMSVDFLFSKTFPEL